MSVGGAKKNYKYQGLQKKEAVWSDIEFAGCGRQRKSTSGGVFMSGSHCIKTHSHTQETIALSSGESEFYGIVKAATVGIGDRSLLNDLGLEMEVHVNTDSSAARNSASMRGAGRARP